ncbi:uncharacterized protein F4822DRAFT_424502 [Hypoxylon trugodes]|uniref:uncharacterized protein n=1 Tax=Hypoxylon trugodes TaxID=326681 RepID=UPI00218DD886|nr:uncharacterized protein F4822DRAFT_424502 [Hypoxylon trugodes]KAI1394036.1 hypothetical protein F4822DRAFT_424502 [Hypoxylon trugodes]
MAWTIDTPRVDGKDKPSGYDSNSLIAIIRTSQCIAAILLIILYISTSSSPSFWLTILSSCAAATSIFWSILAMLLRHRWSIFTVVPEVLITIAWIVLFAVNYVTAPPESKDTTFHLATEAMEASMTLWIPTCLLAVTPYFHRMMPRAFGIKKPKNPGSSGSFWMDGDAGLTLPGTAITTRGKSSVLPPTRAGPMPSDIELDAYLAAQDAEGPLPLRGGAMGRKPTFRNSPLSSSAYRKPVRPVSPLSDYGDEDFL